MSPDLEPAPGGRPEGVSNFALLLARLAWAILGPLLLAVAIYKNLITSKGWLTPWDAAVAAVAAVMIACRWVEMRSGHPTTAYGEPATMAHFRRYGVILLAVSVAAWFVANLVGNHIVQ